VSYERLTADIAALLLVDHRTGLANGVTDQSVPEFKMALTALAKAGRLFTCQASSRRVPPRSKVTGERQRAKASRRSWGNTCPST
jgi:hypothetical protein